MASRTFSRAFLSCSLLAFFGGAHSCRADSSHARVIRLSVVEGDVRFAREAHGDPLADQNAAWERAQANLPIRQGYIVATDDGRAEVEFENGATAFLSANTVLDFYDLSLKDGVRTTRLVLRQGSASFYVFPAEYEYFSVTGGDFTVEADGKGSFRMNNFDDGSNVAVLNGRVSVLHKKDTQRLIKGQFFSMKAGDDTESIGQLPVKDDFDHWVAGRIESLSTATNASLQYTDSSYYAPGFADLYTYGSWFGCGSSGYGWRPFGVGLGWSPFTMGQWMWDPGFGWTWMSFEPWGWAPYHYGGWLFDASCGGWFYSYPGFYPGYYYGVPRKRYPPVVHAPHPLYKAATAVFVRQNGKLGLVPMNPQDKAGRTPINLVHGVFTAELTKGGPATLTAGAGEKWRTVKSPAKEALSNSLVATSAPTRTPRSILEGNGGTPVISLNRDSSIVYDPAERRFVTTNAAAPAAGAAEVIPERNVPGAIRDSRVVSGTRTSAGVAGTIPRAPSAPISARAVAPPSRSVPPPPAPRSSATFGGGTAFGGGAGGYRGGGGSVYTGGGGRGASAPSAPASHPSAPASSRGGGRPH